MNRKTKEDLLFPERIFFNLIKDYSEGHLKNSQNKIFYRAVVINVDTVGGLLERNPPNPPGSVRARVYTNGLDGSIPTEALTIFYPLLPDHIRAPVEPDEHILVMFEDPSHMSNGMWISTVPAYRDINFRDPEENRKEQAEPTSADLFEGTNPSLTISEVNRDIEFGGTQEEESRNAQVIEAFEEQDDSFFENKKVLHIGDNNLIGSYGAEFQTIVTGKDAASYVNEAKANSNVSTWANSNEIPKLIQKYRPDIILVTLGYQDYQIVESPDYLTQLDKFWDQLGSSVVRIWIGPPYPHGPFSEEKNQIDKVATIIKNQSFPNFIDSRGMLTEADKKTNGIDPSQQGGKSWAAQVVNLIEASF